MNLWAIAKSVGLGVVKNMVPGGAAIIDTINAVLPDDRKLSSDATGSEVMKAVDSLPPEQRAAVMEKQFDVDITQIKESNSTVRMMLEHDAKNPHSTRPYIAKQAFHVIAFAVITVVSLWAYGVGMQNKELVAAVMGGWEFVLAVIMPFVTLLWAYFGILKQEHKQKLDAANGQSTPTGIAGILSTVLKR